MDKIELKQKQSLMLTKMSVEELVDRTIVDTFEPSDFKGYQRKINPTQYKRIVESIKNNGFDLPTAIICSKRVENNDTLYVVDGQHRIAAFRWLKNNNPDDYNNIRECELPVVIMNQPKLETEIDTFVTINKTAKKVDTSLALVLKSTINARKKGNDLTIPRAEYLSVELAKKISVDSDEGLLWHGKISFEGPVSHKEQTISLNSFVRSSRRVVSSLINIGYFNLCWNDDYEFEKLLISYEEIFLYFWDCIKRRWPELFNKESTCNRIILGPIGVGAFSHFFVRLLSECGVCAENIKNKLSEVIKNINIESDNWVPGGYYSLFSSESGYNFVANDLWDSINR